MASSAATTDREGRGERAVELVVIGAGAIGLACAWRAAERGFEVLVLDAGRPGPASPIAAGMLAPIGEASWGEERLLRANLAAAERWPEFAAELARTSEIEVPVRRCGSLYVALDRDEAAELERRFELQRRLGLEARTLRASQCRQLEPGLSTAVAGGVEVPSEGEVDPRAALRALALAVERAGGAVERGRRAISVLIGGGEGIARTEGSEWEVGGHTGAESSTRRSSVVGVRLADGTEVEARHVLLAAGAWAGEELLPAGLRPPVRPVAGEIVRLRADRGELPCERIVVSERAYVVPRSSGEVVVGATVEERGFASRVTAGGVHELLREAYRALPEISELELIETAAGLRPGTPDNAPIVGRGAIDGLLLATGHYRNGILLAPTTADAIVALLSGEPPPEELAGFGPERFARGPAPEGVVA